MKNSICPKRFLYGIFIFLFANYCIYSQPVQKDTLIDIGGYSLHFSIIPGENPPILFEPGGTFDGPPWNGTLEYIHEVTGATLITYDRSGFGNSAINPNATEDAAFGIENGMEELETALKKLGYDKDIMLVGHSYGAFYSSLYASRHPQHVKAMVFLNAQLPGYWTDERLGKAPAPNREELSAGDYYLRVNFPATVRALRQADLPHSIHITNIVAGEPIYFMSAQDFEDWKYAHNEFATQAPNREGITAFGSGHYIFQDSEVVFVNAVVRAYADILDDNRKLSALRRGIDMTMRLANEAKMKEAGKNNAATN